MIKTLKKHGNSHALVIDKPIMELLGIDETTELKVVVDGSNLVVSPTNVGIGQEASVSFANEMRETYGETLKNLAE